MNKVILIGNVGNEPDVRYYEADQAVATLRLATTEKGYTLQNGTRVPDRTDWHNLVFYRRLAKVVEQYVHKGDKLYVDGRLQYRQYDDKRGIQRTAVEIIVDNMEMLTPKSTSQANATQSSAPQQPFVQQSSAPQQPNQLQQTEVNQQPAADPNKIVPF